MKKCNSCQELQADTNNFCSKCGSNDFSPIDEQVSPATATVNTEVPTAPAPRKKGKVFVWVGVAAIAVIAFIVLSILFNPADRIMRGIEDDDFLNAANIYQKQVAGDSAKYQKTYDKVSVYVEELLQQFKDQEVTYDYLTNKLYGIEQIGVLGLEITYAYTEADYLHYCRETYALAEKAFGDGDYKEAISLYAQVADADFENGEDALEKYNQAVELFRDEVVSAAQEYIDFGEYSTAMMLLEDALYIVPGDEVLQSAQQSCFRAEYDATIQSLVEEARLYTASNDYLSALNFLDSCIATYPEELILQQEKTSCFAAYMQLLVEEAQLYMASNDYIGALSFLDSCIVSYPEELILQQERSSCLTAYEAYVVAESLRLANAGEFQHALSLAESGLNYFTSTKATELAMVFKSYIPVILGEMEIFQNKTEGGSWMSKTDDTDKYLVDNYGNVYANSLSVGCGSVTYLVNFKYQTFSGTVGFPKGLESDGFRESATLTIFGDGEKIAEFVNVNDTSKPEAFSLDVSSYEKITLSWECKGSNIWSDWGYFATIFDGVFIPIPLDIPLES